MEEKKPQPPHGGDRGRSLDQMGTHGGPAGGTPGQRAGPPEEKSHGAPPEADQPAAPGEGTMASDVDEEAGLAARATSRVKSIARGLMEKKPDQPERGPRSEEEVNEERAEIAQAEASARAAPRPRRTTRPTGKTVRGGKNKADKGMKVGRRGKAGRLAAARGAKKGTRGAGGKLKKQAKRPLNTKSRTALRGPGSAGQGRGAAKGARGKSGGKLRPGPRKGTK